MKPTTKDTLYLHNYFVKNFAAAESDSVLLKCLPDELITGQYYNASVDKISMSKMSLQRQHPEDLIKPVNDDWIFFVLLFAVSVFAFVKYRFSKYVELTLVALFNRKRIDSLHRSTDIKNPLAESLIYFIFLLDLGLLFYYALNYKLNLRIFEGNFMNFTIILLLIFVIYRFKISITAILGYIFTEIELANNYILYIKYYNRIIGLLLLPLVIVVSYGDLMLYNSVIYISFSVFFIILFIRLFRGIQIFMLKDISIVYLILYFCTLEILPLLVIALILFKIIV